MAASAKEKFEAAVNVIHSLPKNGSFQPSYAMMLSFYGLYKQATLGPCNISKPAFWDVVGKAKWDAWNRLNKMPQEQAMIQYVDELKKIIETMPHTENVQEFVERLGDFYEVVDDDTPIARMVRNASPKHQAKSNGPAGAVKLNADLSALNSNSRSSENLSKHSATDLAENSRQLPQASQQSKHSTHSMDALSSAYNGLAHPEVTSDSGSDAEEFCDTIDISNPVDETALSRNSVQENHVDNSISPGGAERGKHSDNLAVALNRLQHDMNSALVRLQAMETLFLAQKEAMEKNQRSLRKPNKWKLFAGVNYPTIAFLVAWPIVVHWILRYMTRKRN